MFFVGLILAYSVNCEVANCTIEKLKSFKAAKSDELCNRQFDNFVRSLGIGEKWATDSKETHDYK